MKISEVARRVYLFIRRAVSYFAEVIVAKDFE